MTAKQPPIHPHATGKPYDDATRLNAAWDAPQILDQLLVAQADLPPRALSQLATQIHQLSRGNAQAVQSYIQQLLNVMHSAQPDQVGVALSSLAWLPADVRQLIEEKIRARHAREQQHAAMEANLHQLTATPTQQQDVVRRIVSYLKSRFEALLQSGALRAAREAGMVLFHHGVVNDPSHRITLSQQQELSPSRTPGMAIARTKSQSTGMGAVRSKK